MSKYECNISMYDCHLNSNLLSCMSATISGSRVVLGDMQWVLFYPRHQNFNWIILHKLIKLGRGFLKPAFLLITNTYSTNTSTSVCPFLQHPCVGVN